MTANGAGVQRLLARLLADRQALLAFRRSPASLGREYGLTPSALAALSGLDAVGLDFTARTVRRKREDRLEQHLPLTFRLLRAAGLLDRVMDAYAARTLPIRRRGGSRLLIEAHRFVTFLADLRLPGLPAYSGDLARYELLRLELSVATTAEPGKAERAEPEADTDPADPDDEQTRNACPVLPDNVRLGSFGYDVTSLAEQLLAAPCVPDAREEPTRLALVEAPEESSYLVYRVPEPVFTILTRCDGSSTL